MTSIIGGGGGKKFLGLLLISVSVVLRFGTGGGGPFFCPSSFLPF